MTTSPSSGWASESEHWYHRDGSPAYEVPNKSKGGMRPTSLADARKLDLVPSVSKIIDCAACYGLERWKAEQLLHAGLTLPHREGESEEQWIDRVWKDSAEQGKKAAERGTDIHALVEMFYRGYFEGLKAQDLDPWVDAVDQAVLGWFGGQKWSSEKSFAHPLGYGGKVDLHSPEVVIDFKTKDSLQGVKLYDEHLMQLAAYGVGLLKNPVLPGMRSAIVFIHRTEPKATIIEASQEELDRGWRMFRALLDYWYAANDFERKEAA
jgi:hypothetical protein